MFLGVFADIILYADLDNESYLAYNHDKELQSILAPDYVY